MSSTKDQFVNSKETRMNNFLKRALILSLLFTVGCRTVSTDPNAAFSEVQKNVARRTGQIIQWKTDSDEDFAVRTKILKMLKNRLTVEAATRIINPDCRFTRGWAISKWSIPVLKIPMAAKIISAPSNPAEKYSIFP